MPNICTSGGCTNTVTRLTLKRDAPRMHQPAIFLKVKTGTASDFMSMPLENKSLHVLRLTERWVVEKDDGTSVGEAENQESAVALARENARREGASEIAIHSEDGEVEKTISIED